MLRLRGNVVDTSRPAIKTGVVANPVLAVPAGAAKKSSAQRARDSVSLVVTALEAARVEVNYSVREDGSEVVQIHVMGGATLPPNRVMNIGREQSKLSQRSFSRYKHACANRMRDASLLLQAKIVQSGRRRFNETFEQVQIAYVRQVSNKARLIDEDAVAYSFKYVLDGLVKAGVLVDDSHRHIRMGAAEQRVGAECLLVIELVATSKSSKEMS